VTHSRRTMLSLLPAALVTACSATRSGTASSDGATPVRPATPSVTPSTTSGTTPPGDVLGSVDPWLPPDGEAHLTLKRLVTDAVEAIGSWSEPEGALTAAARARGLGLGLPPEVVDSFGELLEPAAVAARTQVVYPQLGGLTATESSIMTVVSQELLMSDGSRHERGNVLDVRLAAREGVWAVRGVVPTAPVVPIAPGGATPSEAARRVLEHPRLVLPPSAAADVMAGGVDDSILSVLAGLADRHDLQVQVFYDGHPTNVFGTDRASRHSQGRAVDIVQVDGVWVNDPSMPRATLEAVMILAGQLGATEIGGPFDVNGPGRGYFTDAVHLDHLHVAVGVGVPPAAP
jgi:hypothetical protein